MGLKQKLFLKLLDITEEELIEWFAENALCPSDVGYNGEELCKSDEACSYCWKLSIEKEK